MKKNLNPWFFWSLFLLLVTPLLLRFNWSNGRDSAVYANGFKDLVNGEDPYADEIFRSGLLGSFPFYLIERALPQSLEALAFLALGILGASYFVRFFIGKANTLSNLVILIFVIWSSSSREALNTIQITGVVLALIASVLFSVRELSKPNFKLSIIFLGSVSMAISVDLKPHLVMPLFLILFSYRRYWMIVVPAFTLWFVSHLLIDMITGKAWTLSWFNLMFELATRPTTPERSDFVNVWSVFSNIFGDNAAFNIIPYLTVFVIIALSIFYKVKDPQKIMFISTFAALLTTYSHYYDYVSMVALCVIKIVLTQSNFLNYAYLGFIMLSQNLGDRAGLILVFFALFALAFVKVRIQIISTAKTEVKKIILGLGLFLGMHLICNTLGRFGFQEGSISATLVLVTSTVIFLYRPIKRGSNDSFSIAKFGDRNSGA